MLHSYLSYWFNLTLTYQHCVFFYVYKMLLYVFGSNSGQLKSTKMKKALRETQTLRARWL